MIKFKKKKAKKEPKKQEKKVPIGRTIKTKDKYLPFDKRKVQKLKDERWVVVVDKNTNEELAIVRLTTKNSKNSTCLPTYKKGNKEMTYFKHFVEIEDKEGKPIKIDNRRFFENTKAFDLNKDEINLIQQTVRGKCKQAATNKEKIKKLKSSSKK